MDGRKMTEKIKFNLLKDAFGPRPHDFYITYDELTDELIVRVIDPTRLAYLQELVGNDGFALLVEPDSNEIIGFQLFNFEKQHLQQPSWSNLRENWVRVKNSYRNIGFAKYRYDPRMNEGIRKASQRTSQEFYNQSVKIVQKELVKSPA
jgi:hypothetical protein